MLHPDRGCRSLNSVFRIGLGASLAFLTIACRPGTPVEDANAAFDSGDVARGLAILAEAVEANPADPRLQFEYGSLLIRGGKSSRATWPLFRSGKAPEYREQANLLVAKTLVESQDYRNAIRILNKLLDEEPNLESALKLRATARVKGHEEALAIEDLDRILEKRPHDFDILQEKLEAFLRMGDEVAAEAQLLEIEEVLSTAEDVPESFHPRFCALKAVFLNERGLPEEANVRFAECLAEYPGDMLLVGRAVQFYDQIKEYQTATDVLEAALAAGGDRVEPVLALASRYSGFGQTGKVQELLLEYAEKLNVPILWAELSQFYVNIDRYEDARAAIERAWLADGSVVSALEEAEGVESPFFDVDSMNEEGLFRLGDILALLKEEEKVAEIINRLEEPAHKHFLAARIKIELGDDRGALEEYQKGFRYWPSNPGARYLAAGAAAREGRFEDAVMHYRESLRSDLAATPAGYELARLEMANGRVVAAANALALVCKGNPENVKALRLWAAYARHAGLTESMENARSLLSQVPGQWATAIADHAFDVAAAIGPQAAIDYIGRMAPGTESNPQNREVLNALSQLEISIGAGQAALDRIHSIQAAQRRPEGALERIRGDVLLALGQTQQASEAFALARKVDKTEWRALIASARLAIDPADTDRAVAWYDMAVKYSPDPDIPRYEAALRLMKTSSSLAQQRDGESRMAELLNDVPYHGGAAYHLAMARYKSGESDEDVVELARRATKFAPTPESLELADKIKEARGE